MSAGACTHRDVRRGMAVRHRAMASSTLTCFQVIHLRASFDEWRLPQRGRDRPPQGGGPVPSTRSVVGRSFLALSESRGLPVALR